MNTEKHDIKLLYVEDEPTAREEMTKFLARRVSELHVAEDGKMGLALFMQQKPELVVTDIKMPNMDGLKMTKEIKEISPQTPIIITSAHSDTNYLIEAIDLGVDGYVLKPIETEKLSNAIRKCVENIILKRQADTYHAEREKLIQDLQEALANVKLLSGFIPICASCKMIRTDKGYWQQVEQYITEHSEALFSHTVCPDCTRKLYPEIYERMYAKDLKKTKND